MKHKKVAGKLGRNSGIKNVRVSTYEYDLLLGFLILSRLQSGEVYKWGRLISGGRAYKRQLTVQEMADEWQGQMSCVRSMEVSVSSRAIVNNRRIIKSYFDVKTTCFVLRRLQFHH